MREVYVVGSKAEGAELFKLFANKAPDTGHKATGFDGCPAGFWSSFGSPYAHIPSFWMKVCILCFCMLDICNMELRAGLLYVSPGSHMASLARK